MKTHTIQPPDTRKLRVKTPRPGRGLTAYAAALVQLRWQAGLQLTIARERKGLSQRALVQQLGLRACSFLHAIETGRVGAPAALIPRIAEALDAPELVAILERAREPIPESVLLYLLQHPKRVDTLVRQSETWQAAVKTESARATRTKTK